MLNYDNFGIFVSSTEAKPVAEPIPSYQDPNLGVYPAAPTSDQVPYQAPTSDSVPYQAPTSDQVPYQAPTDAITPDQPKTYSADAPPAQKGEFLADKQ